MKPVQFTQYLWPNGRQREVLIDRPEEVAQKAQALREAGLRLEAEILSTGEVAFSVNDGEEDLVIELSPNGPGVEEAVDRLILDFDLETYQSRSSEGS